jgi:hypothetical protein
LENRNKRKDDRMNSTRAAIAIGLLIALPLAADMRSPVPDTVANVIGTPEDVESGIFIRRVNASADFSATSGTANVLIGNMKNARPTVTGPLRVEIWGSVMPPILGENIQFRVLGYEDLPFVLGAGELRSGVTVGPISLQVPPPNFYYITVALTEYRGGEWSHVDIYTLPGVRFIGPRLIFSKVPNGLVQRADTGGATDRIEFGNLGTIEAEVSVTILGDFFTVSPTSFTVSPRTRQTLTITGSPKPAGFYRGEIIVRTGERVVSIPVGLLSAEPPEGSVRVDAQTRRVDVRGEEGSQPRGQVRFTNVGNARLVGFPVSSHPWLIPDPGVVQLDPGQSAVVGFTCLRDLRTDVTALTVVGTLSLRYVVGLDDVGGKTVFDTPPTTLAGVVVTDTKNPETTASSVPPLSENEVAIVVPGVGHVTGSGGREFISDLSLVNARDGLTIGDLKMYYSSTTASKASPQSSIAAGASVNLADVVTTYFGETEQVGTIHLRSKSTGELGVAANVFNKSNLAGTYGTAIPAFRSDRSARKGESLHITGLVQNETAHTNLYVQEMSGEGDASVSIEFFDESGAMVGTLTPQPASSFGLVQLPSQVPPGAVSARVNVTSDGGAVAVYATPVDDASGDTWAVADWSRQASLGGADRKIVPVAGAAPGANNTNFKTDLALTNVENVDGQADVTYYPSGGAPVTKSVALGGMQSTTLTDVVRSFFGVEGTSVGWISVDPISGSWQVSSRTYTQQDGDPATFGTGVATLGESAALKSGEFRVFGGLEDTTLETVSSGRGATFRTNLGLVEVSGKAATILVSVSFADGNELAAGGSDGTREIALEPNGFIQLSGVVRSVIGDSRDTSLGDLTGVQVRVEVVDGEGSVIPYVTSTDNGTGDTVLRTE